MAMDSPDKNHIEGAFDLPYAIPNLKVRQLRVKTAVPVGSWRSVGHSYNAFFTECFLDELAHAAGQDPVAYRQQLLAAKPRHLGVLALAASQAGWGKPLPAGIARGVAVHESFGSFCAQVAEVSLVDGAPRVTRVVCAIDCGIVVNPDTVKAQMESGIVYGLSAALFGEITIDAGHVVQTNFSSYDVVRLASMPRVEVHIVPSSAAPGGVGEPGTPPIAPAVANALFALTGKRLRRLPLRAEDLKT
jgi:isoquinoline 1-oxidoreductase beta subunit